MSDWPPKPENETPKQQPVHEQPTGNEWKLLEKAVLASVSEIGLARGWAIFFNCLTFAYFWFIFIVPRIWHP